MEKHSVQQAKFFVDVAARKSVNLNKPKQILRYCLIKQTGPVFAGPVIKFNVCN